MLQLYDYVGSKLRYMEDQVGKSVMPRYKINGWSDEFFEQDFVYQMPPHKYVYNLGSAEAAVYIDASEAEVVARVEQLMTPLGVDITNWSLNMNGGYTYASGNGGWFRGDLQAMLEYPFVRSFLQNDAEVINLIQTYRTMPQANSADWPIFEAARDRLCETLSRRLKH